MEPRAYQISIFETAKKSNTLVVLPTGLGKTLIALMLAQERLRAFPDSKILFLAPTKPLVEQHFDYFKKNFNREADMHIFTGNINASIRADIWKKAQIVFSTPQCIHNDLANGLIDLKSVSLLVEDECHRCLKNYSYTYVSQQYKNTAAHERILGLTASPASEAKIIKQVYDNLGITAVEIRTRESEDVKPYLQTLTQELIKIDLPENLKEIRETLNVLYKRKIEELKNRQLLFGPATKKNILDLQVKLRRMVTTGNTHFNILCGLSVCAQAIKVSHVLELLETQSINSCLEYINELFQQAKEGKSKAVRQVANSKELGEAYVKLVKLQEAKVEHPKLELLRQSIMNELNHKPDLRAIIFAQYRDTISQINDILVRQGIKSKIFIGQAKRKNVDGLSQKEQHLILDEFRKGEISCLVASSVGEEGLDIPEVDLVIFYEPIPSAIRQIQRRGRTARLKQGKLIILMTQGTRDESYHWAALQKERKMNSLLDNFQMPEKKLRKQKSIEEF
jgi:ERCC4-related helicase